MSAEEEVPVKIEEIKNETIESESSDIGGISSAEATALVDSPESGHCNTEAAAAAGMEVDESMFERLERERSISDFFDGKNPRWLENTKWDRRSSIGKKKFVFIDLSGTLHIDKLPTRLAVEALNALRQFEFKVLFVTNTTKESKRLLHERLIQMGFAVEPEEIYSSMNASRRYLEKNNLRPFFMVAAEAMEDFVGIPTENPNAVLIGLSSSHFSYLYMNEAWRILSLPDTQLLAIHKGRELKVADGWDIGPGPFVFALEVASQKKAIVLGKPEEEFFASAMQYAGCDNVADVVMIGDDIRDDVLGAMKLGMTGIWVQTGKSSGIDAIKPHEPDFAVADFADAVALIFEKTADVANSDNMKELFRLMADKFRYTPSRGASDNLLMLR